MAKVIGPENVQQVGVARDPGVRASPDSFGAPVGRALSGLAAELSNIASVAGDLAEKRRNASERLTRERFKIFDDEKNFDIIKGASTDAGQYATNLSFDFQDQAANSFQPRLDKFMEANPGVKLSDTIIEEMRLDHDKQYAARVRQAEVVVHNDSILQFSDQAKESISDIQKLVHTGRITYDEGVKQGDAIIDSIGDLLDSKAERALRDGLKAEIAEADQSALRDPNNPRYDPKAAVSKLSFVTPDKRDLVQFGYQFYQQNGLKDFQAAALLGHFDHESSFNPKNDKGDGGTAFGIAQWRGSRKDRLDEFAASRGKPWHDGPTQIRFSLWELQNDEPEAYQALLEARNLDEAVAAVMIYERPKNYHVDGGRGGLHFDRRLAKAQAIYGAGGDLTTIGYSEDLTFDEQQVLLKKAQASRNVSNSIFANEVKNTIGALRAGVEADPYSQDTLVSELGDSRGDLAFQAQERAIAFGEIVRDIPMQSKTDGLETLLGMRAKAEDPANSADFIANSKDVNDYLKLLSDKQEALEDDPATYAMAADDSLAGYWQRANELSSDKEATLTDIRAAHDLYAEKMEEYQRSQGLNRLGIKLIPAAAQKAILDEFKSQEGGGQTITKFLQQQAAIWGERWPQIVQQLDLPPGIKAIANMRGRAAETAAELLTVPIGDLEKKVTSEAKKSINGGVAEAMTDFNATFSHLAAKDSATTNGYREVIYRLALQYTSEGTDASDAVARAYDEVIGQSWTMRQVDNGMLRIPVEHDSGNVAAGLSRSEERLREITDLFIPESGTGLSDEAAREFYIRNVIGHGQFANSPDDTGAGLLGYDGNFVTTIDPDSGGRGDIVSWTWEDLERQGELHPVEGVEAVTDEISAIVMDPDEAVTRDGVLNQMEAGLLRPFNPEDGVPRQNEDGTQSTELTATIEMDGQVALVPTLYFDRAGNAVDIGELGPEGVAEVALLYEEISGKQFPRFSTEAEANEFAKQRSQGGGATKAPLAQEAEETDDGEPVDDGQKATTVAPFIPLSKMWLTKATTIQVFEENAKKNSHIPDEVALMEGLIDGIETGDLSIQDAREMYLDGSASRYGGAEELAGETGKRLPRAKPSQGEPAPEIVNDEGVALPRPKPGKSIPQKNMDLAVEFEAEIEPFLDNVARLGFDIEKSSMLTGEGKDVKGFYIPAEISPAGMMSEEIHYKPLTKGQLIERDNIYIAADGASDASVYAHEFRHRGYTLIRHWLQAMASGGEDEAFTTIAKLIKQRGLNRATVRDIKKVLVKLKSRLTNSETVVAYMDRHGSFAQKFKDKGPGHLAPAGTSGAQFRTMLIPVVASHLAQIMKGRGR